MMAMLLHTAPAIAHAARRSVVCRWHSALHALPKQAAAGKPPALAQVGGMFTGLQRLLQRGAGPRDRERRLKQARDELLALLSAAPPAGEGAGRADEQRISDLVDELSSAGLPFREALLEGGPWVVRSVILSSEHG